MTAVLDMEAHADIGVSLVDMPEELSAIRHQGCPATVWQREIPPDFQSWIDALNPRQLPRARVVVRPRNVRAAILRICEASGTPSGEAREWLIDDATALADTFASLMRAPYLRLRLDVIATNACRKFHIDAVTARLICTYRGTGTQYGMATDKADSGKADPGHVYTVHTGSPILLRGTLWPDQPKPRLVHRSPPIEGTGETRLLYVIDPVSEMEALATPQFPAVQIN